ncbi:hypothetical protein GCK32_018458 [Trichostrongylus colubriformis]|uniref:Uncharacterized protein n=1 Tax=Trichostrongylus colubriformis TaxID=6319 RepID=A0AAN8IE11_TRICO
MCTITTYLDPQRKIITNVLMFGEKTVVPRLSYEFDQNKYVLKVKYSCFDEHCNSVDELMTVLRDESAKKVKGSALAEMTLLAIESRLMRVTPGKFGERQGVVYELCVYMLTLFAMIAFIHMTTTILMYLKHFNKKKPA